MILVKIRFSFEFQITGIIISSSSFLSLLLYILLLNCTTTLLMNLRGKFALLNFSLIFLTSFWKFEDIFLARQSSPNKVLDLDSQETGDLLSFLCTDVTTWLFKIIISVSKNLLIY